MNSRPVDPIETWFNARTGTWPKDIYEALGLWYEEFFALNPDENKLRELIVEYAESTGGTTLEFLKKRWGHYWGGGRIRPGSEVAAEMGLSLEDRRKSPET